MSHPQPEQDSNQGTGTELNEEESHKTELKTSDVYHTKNIPERFDHPGESERRESRATGVHVCVCVCTWGVTGYYVRFSCRESSLRYYNIHH